MNCAESGSESYQEEEKSIVQKPFKKTLFGSLCLFLIQLISVVWVINFMVIDADYYFDCEFRGIDSMCFYGSYPIFGDYDLQSEFFFTNWILCFAWFVILLVYKDQLVGWFMVPSTMQDATHMYVWTKNEVCSNITTYVLPCV